MPTTYTNMFSQQKLEPVCDPDLARQRSVSLAPSQNLARGTVLGELSAAPGVYKAYSAAAADGSQVAKLILTYDVTVDANGNITLTQSAGVTGGPFGETVKSCPAYANGAFKTTDLVGLDATAMTDLGAHLEQGTLANGIVRIP
jgi:hypothetical protein